MGTERTDGNGENCDFLCSYIDISFLFLNFIKIELYFHGADNSYVNYRHHGIFHPNVISIGISQKKNIDHA